MTNVKKPPMKNAADILILIGTILVTVGAFCGFAFLILMYVTRSYNYYYFPHDYMYYDWLPLLIIAIITLVITTAFLVLSWIAYNQTLKNSKDWAIYGLVQAILSGAFVSVVGYVLALVHFNTDIKPVIKPVSTDESIKLTSQLAAAKAELAALKAAQAFQKSQENANNTVQEENASAVAQEANFHVIAATEATVAETSVIAEESKQAE